MPEDKKRTYPLPKFHFQLDWGGTRVGFTEVTGLDFETEVIKYREGTDLSLVQTSQPGMKKYSNVTLKRGTFLGDMEFYDEWKKTFMFQEKSKTFRRDVTIKLLNEEHKPIISWTLLNAWPSKIQSTDLKADGNEVAIETMELVHEGLTVEGKK